PGVLRSDEIVAGCHAMAPRYLTDQIERSRRNLGVDTIDIYYLHNPESQLDEVARPEFRRRVRGAFEALELAARERRIGAYGTATWRGYRKPAGAPEWLSLAELLTIACEVGGDDHHFRFVQLPYNLVMREAARLPNQMHDGRNLPLFDAAGAAGLYVMT